MGSYCELEIQSKMGFSILLLKHYKDKTEKIDVVDFDLNESKISKGCKTGLEL